MSSTHLIHPGVIDLSKEHADHEDELQIIQPLTLI